MGGGVWVPPFEGCGCIITHISHRTSHVDVDAMRDAVVCMWLCACCARVVCLWTDEPSFITAPYRHSRTLSADPQGKDKKINLLRWAMRLAVYPFWCN